MMQTTVIILYAVLSLVTLAAYGRDKVASTRGAWRTRESTLLWLAAAGGFAGAIIGTQIFKHKTRKLAFRVIPWLAAVVHLAAWVLIKRG
jgi:uncharacterized membrane protein YsdA (DUF1294 family)